MDFVVHINDGTREVQPIVLRLLPGEETRFNLKVVNHGEPSNVSLEASDPLMKAVRLKRPDSYVASEESIPIMVRMPQRAKRVEGELLLTSSGGSSSVPISLIRESKDYGDDSFSADIEDEVGDMDGDGDGNRNRNGDGTERSTDDEVEEEEEGDIEGWKEEADGSSEEAENVEKIKFSREKDLERYKAASRSRGATVAGFGDSNIGGPNYQEQGHSELSYDQKYPDHGNEMVPDHSLHEQILDQMPQSSLDEDGLRADADEVSGESESLAERLLSFNWERGSMQIVPAAILFSVIIALVLTFYTESIPMFAGALASSILIVTLIIYGAATLLKA